MSARDINRPVRFMVFSWMNAVPLLLLMIFPTLFAFFILILVSTLLYVLEKRNMPPKMAFRYLRSALVGPKRMIWPWWVKNFKIN